MNKEKILAMTAGKLLDSLVAEDVMGVSSEMFEFMYEAGMRNYSSDISAAWEVLEEIKNNFPARNFQVKGGKHMGGYEAIIIGHYTHELVSAAFCDTAPLAICKAALLAVMEETK